jgi:hypothetical protein
MKNLYFLHIPKTSGTSINKVIEDAYGNENMFPYKTWGYINEKTERKELVSDLYSDRYKYVTGHYGWNKKITNNRVVFAMFRNPNSRVVSQLQHIFKYKEYPVWSNNLYNFENGLLTSIFDPTLSKYLSNVQTKYLLANVDLYDEMLKIGKDQFFFLDQDEGFQKSINIPMYLLNIILFSKLIKLHTFGLQEFHEESIFLLSDALGLPMQPNGEKKNPSEICSDSYKVTIPELERLNEINKYDNLLYYIASKIFKYRWTKFLKRKLDRNLSFEEYLLDRDNILMELGGDSYTTTLLKHI